MMARVPIQAAIGRKENIDRCSRDTNNKFTADPKRTIRVLLFSIRYRHGRRRP
jgi:hypothetical protein